MAVSARIETFSVILIAVVVLLGGPSLLAGIAHYRTPALLVLALILFVQCVALRRNYAQGGALVRIRATRDVAFVAAIVLAIITTASPQRWSVGSTIVALEFGFVLDLLGRYAPPPM